MLKKIKLVYIMTYPCSQVKNKWPSKLYKEIFLITVNDENCGSI